MVSCKISKYFSGKKKDDFLRISILFLYGICSSYIEQYLYKFSLRNINPIFKKKSSAKCTRLEISQLAVFPGTNEVYCSCYVVHSATD